MHIVHIDNSCQSATEILANEIDYKPFQNFPFQSTKVINGRHNMQLPWHQETGLLATCNHINIMTKFTTNGNCDYYYYKQKMTTKFVLCRKIKYGQKP